MVKTKAIEDKIRTEAEIIANLNKEVKKLKAELKEERAECALVFALLREASTFTTPTDPVWAITRWEPGLESLNIIKRKLK